MSPTRYNLRKKASGPRKGAHSGLAPLPGTLPASSPQSTDHSSDSELSDVPSARSVASVQPGVSYSQATCTNTGADTGSLRDQEADPRTGAGTISLGEREAHLSSVAPQSGTAGNSSLSASDKENIINSIISNLSNPENPTAAHEELEDKDNGPWTEVHCRRKHSPSGGKHRLHTPVRTSLGGLPADGWKGQPSVAAGLSCEQRRIVKAAENSLTEEQHGRIHKRMRQVRHNRASCSSSCEEGLSTFTKGKTVDARNWGVAGLNSKELDPDMQHRELEAYSGHRVLREDDSNADSDEQCAALEYWRAMKKMQRAKRPKATVHTDTEPSDGDRDPEDESSRGSSVVQPTCEEDLQRQIDMLQQELAEVRSARQPQPKPSHKREKGKHVAIQSSESEADIPESVNLGTSVSKGPAATFSAKKLHKSNAGKPNKRRSMKTGAALPDPSQGMATAFIEEALSPGSSACRSRTAEPNVRLPQPISQLEPSSFIGRTLRGLSNSDPSSSDDSSLSESSDDPPYAPWAGPSERRHPRRSRSNPSCSASLEEPSGSGGSPSSSDSEESSSSRSGRSSCGRRHQHRKRRSSQKRRSSKKHLKCLKLRVPVLKPLDPEPYEGEADLPTFHRFIGQMSDYLERYRVQSRDHPSVVTRFLRGRAHEFYVNTISRNPRAYRFKDILVGLFNYCFPMNFCQKMREKLRNTRQHGRSIQSYSYEMENLFLILGMDRNEERVDAFWFGLDKYIQSELWKQMMTLKSPYEDIKAKAQVIELVCEVAGGVRTEHVPLRNGGSHRRREPGASAPVAAAMPQLRCNDRPYGHP